MTSEPLGFFARIWLAFLAPWKILFGQDFAQETHRLLQGKTAPPEESLPPESAEPEKQESAVPTEVDPTPALQLLSILQREGRFVDFLEEDVTAYGDADVGAAARVVHQGCRKALKDFLVLKAVRQEAEGDSVTLDPGYDAARTRVTGNVVGEPPFKGQLAHHGWEVESIRLPTLAEGHDPKVIAAAEVEL